MRPINRSLATLTAFVGLALYGANRASADVSYPAFTSTSGLQLVGSAALTGGRLRLTPAAGTSWVSGGTWLAAKQQVQAGFSTTFQFQITEPDRQLGGGDGFAFVIQNAGPSALGAAGRGLGYGGGDAASGGIANSIAVEFDTYKNAGDPNDNHISVHTRGTVANSDDERYSLGSTTSIPRLKDGAVHTARVAYAPGSLSVFVDGSSNAALTVSVDLGTLLTLDAGGAYVGFTSSVATARENHDLISWTFSAYPARPDAPSDLVLTNVSAKQVAIAWKYSGATVTSFEIQRANGGAAFGTLGSADGSARSYTDLAVLPQTPYRYRVRAIGPGGTSDFSSEVTATTKRTMAVLLVHGTWSGAGVWNNGMTAGLSSDGNVVEAVDFPSEAETRSNETYIELQAKALARRIRELLTRSGQSSVNLVCHSMGGLAARFYLTHPNLWTTDRSGKRTAAVAKLIMLGTPNLGTDGFLLDPVAIVAFARTFGINYSSRGERYGLDRYRSWSPALKEMFAEWEPAPLRRRGGFVYAPGFSLAEWQTDYQGFLVSPMQLGSYAFAIKSENDFSGSSRDNYLAVKEVLDAFPVQSSSTPGAHADYYTAQAQELGVPSPRTSGATVGVETRLVSPFLYALNRSPDTSGARVYIAAGDYPVVLDQGGVVVHGPFSSATDPILLTNDGVVPTDSALGRDPITKQMIYPNAVRQLFGVNHTSLPSDGDVIAAVRGWLQEP